MFFVCHLHGPAPDALLSEEICMSSIPGALFGQRANLMSCEGSALGRQNALDFMCKACLFFFIFGVAEARKTRAHAHAQHAGGPKF